MQPAFASIGSIPCAGRYKSLVVEGRGNGYLWTVCDYVHLNPVRAKLIRRREPLESFRWSSYGQSEAAQGAPALDASGPPIGGGRDSEGQWGGARGIRAGDGRAAPKGGRG